MLKDSGLVVARSNGTEIDGVCCYCSGCEAAGGSQTLLARDL